MKNFLFLFSVLFLGLISSAQNDKSNRDAFKLEIAIDSINFYEQNVERSPYFVKEKVLQIYPSETLLIETEIKGDSIYSMKVVKENINPEKTIIIDFQQEVKNKQNERMILSVTNPFNKTLRYEALMFVNGGSDWTPTSIIPVRPKLKTFEMWNDVILSMVLVEWRFGEN